MSGARHDEPLSPRLKFISEYHGSVDDAERAWTRLQQRTAENGADPGREDRFRLLSVEELWDRPPLTWTVEGLIPDHAKVQLYGPQGSYKSFFALGLAWALATDTAFLGHRVLTSGDVVYIAAEDIEGLAMRTRALGHYHADSAGRPLKPRQLRVLPKPLLLLRAGDVRAFTDRVAQQIGGAPLAVVIDTTARCLPGAPTNADETMSALVAALDEIQDAFTDRPLLIPVHHTGLVGDHSRGGTAFPYACDVQLLTEKPTAGGIGAFTVVKQRNEETGKRVGAKLELVPEAKSAVLVTADAPAKAATKPTGVERSTARQAYDALRRISSGTYAAWFDEAKLSDSTFKRVRAELLEAGRVRQDGSIYFALPAGNWQ